jgi:Phosphotransferase system, mannose/fructose-specific component IIA
MSSSSEEGSSTAEPPRAIVAGHGSLPQGLVNAVDCIAGRGSDFLVLSNYGLAGADIEEKLREEASRNNIKVFFTDLPGGSATVAVRRMMRTDPTLVLVTGANLSTLLEFVFHTEADPAEAARIAAEKGRGTLVAFSGGSAKPVSPAGDR